MTDLDDALRSRRTAPGRHYVTTDQPTDPRVAFRQAALAAIPADLIYSPAVGAGVARRYMLADAMWPVAEPLLAAAYDRGLAEGRRQATEGARELTRRWWWPGLADARQDFERLVGPWEPDEQPVAAVCGVTNSPGGIFRPATCGLAPGHPGWHEDGGLSWIRGPEELARVVERHEPEPASGGVVEPSGPLTAEESDLYPKVHDPEDERRADDAHMAAGEAWMEHDAEGEDRG